MSIIIAPLFKSPMRLIVLFIVSLGFVHILCSHKPDIFSLVNKLKHYTIKKIKA